ncbi:MAG: succinylglutamate desuccinylase/aspartoacylase family protein [Bryobacterales bacterium]|nr:succinylglutamate desuccinylase/aspartoacylase family protein [Bryobacterales bacterium]
MLREGWSRPIEGVDVWHRHAGTGPTVLLTAGVHGDEYEGPAALIECIDHLRYTPVTGRVIVIPVANPMAWRGASRLSPEDGLNLARVFPGKAHGTPTEHLASQIWTLAEEADFLIDLHSGGSDYTFLPLAGYYGNASLDAACRFGLPVLWNLPETNGVLSCEMHRCGKTAVGCEYLGGGQLSRPGVQAYTRGVRSCLALWGLLPNEQPRPANGDRYTGDWMLAEAEGAFVATARLGDMVEAGASLATIRNTRGEPLQEFKAATHGRVLAIRSKGYIRKGDWGVLVAKYA